MLIRGPHLTEPGKSFPTRKNKQLFESTGHCLHCRSTAKVSGKAGIKTLGQTWIRWTLLPSVRVDLSHKDVRGAYRSIHVEHHPRFIRPKGQKKHHHRTRRRTLNHIIFKHHHKKSQSLSTKKNGNSNAKKKSCQNVQSHLPSPISHLPSPSSGFISTIFAHRFQHQEPPALASRLAAPKSMPPYQQNPSSRFLVDDHRFWW